MEIELKYNACNKSVKEIEILINSNGGKLIRSIHEIDTYYNVFGRDSIKTKECLRVRENTDGMCEITYKPGDENLSEKKHFAKKETNLRVADSDIAKRLLELIGNTIVAVVNKSRRYYEIDDCTICLDHIKDIGSFIEIEINDDDRQRGLTKIYKYANLFKLHDRDIEVKPYRDLVIALSQSKTTQD